MRPGLKLSSTVYIAGVFLAAVGWCRTDWAQDVQVRRSRQGHRTAPILLLSRADIQQELKLSPEQVGAARSFAGELRRKARALQGKSGDGVLAARRSIDDQQTQWLTKNLTAPQLDRLHQLDLQWEGPVAVQSRPIIADYLKLSPEQRQKIDHLISDHDAHRGDAPAYQEVEDAFQNRILAVLSDEQRSQWKTLEGKPFRFQGDARVGDAQTAQAGAGTAR